MLKDLKGIMNTIRRQMEHIKNLNRTSRYKTFNIKINIPLDGIKIKLYTAEQKMSELEDTTTEIIQMKSREKKRLKKF